MVQVWSHLLESPEHSSTSIYVNETHLLLDNFVHIYLTELIGHVLHGDLTIAGTLVTCKTIPTLTPTYGRAQKVVTVLLTAIIIHKTLIDI